MKLPLAIDIADRAASAHSEKTALDIRAQANDLVTSHPEADATIEEVEEALATEMQAQGIPPDNATIT